MVVIVFASIIAFILSLILARSFLKPVTQLLSATRKMAHGELGYEVPPSEKILELNQLAESFNEMSIRLKERESSLKLSNEKMLRINEPFYILWKRGFTT